MSKHLAKKLIRAVILPPNERYFLVSLQVDLLLINPGGRSDAYQNLGHNLAAIEPPFWIGLLASNARNAGYNVRVLDAEAMQMSPQSVAQEVAKLQPILAATVVFGANPSASTQKMPSARAICNAINQLAPDVAQMLAGLHVSALPERTLREEQVDFVCQGEGPQTIRPLLKALKAQSGNYTNIPGLWYQKGQTIFANRPAPLIQDLDTHLPSVAWDLLPMDKYRAHNWHCFGDLDTRKPYAVIYTSLGCPYNCSFCCINSLFGRNTIRYRSIGQVIEEIDLLVEKYNVRTIKISDELFVLKKSRVEQFCDMLIERDYGLNIWAYARVDTVNPALLSKLRAAGVRWLAYGFESASNSVRDGVDKGFASQAMANAIRWTQQAGIYIIANYILGLPDDDLKTMRQTLKEAKMHNFEYLNLYCAMAYPGSQLYQQALAQGPALPPTWNGYSQLGQETFPLATKYLTAKQVLRFRDQAFVEYYSRPEYLAMVRQKFGPRVEAHIYAMLEHKIKRKQYDGV